MKTEKQTERVKKYIYDIRTRRGDVVRITLDKQPCIRELVQRMNAGRSYQMHIVSVKKVVCN